MDPWENSYVYGHYQGYSSKEHGRVAHILSQGNCLCDIYCNRWSATPNPYPVCKNCLRTKRAKELGL